MVVCRKSISAPLDCSERHAAMASTKNDLRLSLIAFSQKNSMDIISLPILVLEIYCCYTLLSVGFLTPPSPFIPQIIVVSTCFLIYHSSIQGYDPREFFFSFYRRGCTPSFLVLVFFSFSALGKTGFVSLMVHRPGTWGEGANFKIYCRRPVSMFFLHLNNCPLASSHATILYMYR